ncbi:MAG: FAD-binding protein, partial [Verrucomicrobiaceae bacterium]
VWSNEDTFEAHVQDTLVAGAGLCREPIVEICVREGPARVRELIDWGVQFTRSTTQTTDPAEAFDLHREGGHGQRRILHADDLTGLAIETALLAKVALDPRISLLEDFCAIDLIHARKISNEPLAHDRCLGIYALNTRTGKVETIAADTVVLATGGAGKAYLYTTNPDTSTGDGIAMAARAGARIANMEFIQFHPTCLYHPAAKTFLITEALRGEGAILRNLAGESFMENYDERGSLAPRDIVARSIDMEMKRTGQKHVWLDCTSLGEHELKTKFPNIYETCAKFGLKMENEFLPVVPATHYTCGGVLVNEWGESSVPGLYAIGEASSTGLHGANRLASNSLLEAVVFAHRVAEHATED